MRKEIVIFILTYLITSIVRGFIIAYTGFSFINIFYDKFEFIPFIADLGLWTGIYLGVRFFLNKFTKNPA